MESHLSQISLKKKRIKWKNKYAWIDTNTEKKQCQNAQEEEETKKKNGKHENYIIWKCWKTPRRLPYLLHAAHIELDRAQKNGKYQELSDVM